MRQLVVFLLIAFVGCNQQGNNNQVIAVQQFFKLDERLQSVDLQSYLDGGTIGLQLTDIHGNKSSICIDNECFGISILKSEENLPETKEYIKRLKQKCLYLGATHPENEGAIKIEYHSALETDVLEHIQKMMSKNPQYKDEFSKFMEATKSERELKVVYVTV